MRLRTMTLAGALVFAACIGPANAQITVPAGNVPILTTFGDGIQIYQSQLRTDGSNTYQWTFIAPSATLYVDSTKTIPLGKHFTGPTWQLDSDGSSVVGARIGSAPSPNPNAIPQLLLSAKSYGGSGLLDTVTFIQRLDTVGGLAPTTDPTGAGQEFDAPYTATYKFYAAATPEPGALTLLAGMAVPGAIALLRRRKARI